LTIRSGIVPASAHFKSGEIDVPLINIVIALVIAGLALWLINRYIPMASGIRTILNIVVTVAVGVWVLQVTGLWGPVTNFRLPR
jgi:hypothetical protein